MSFYYTDDMIEFVTELRDQGYTWPEIEHKFFNQFGIRKSHDTLRISARNYLMDYDETEAVDDVDVPTTKRQTRELPDYVHYTPKKHTKGKSKKRGTALIIPDTHIPYHDEKAYALMLDVAKSVKDLSEIVILGDYADFYAVNSHGKHPDFSHVLVDEVNLVKKELERLNELFPKVKKVFIAGNHEYRLERYIQNNCPELYGLADTRSVLELDRLGYEYIPYGANQKYQILGSKLYARHEPIGGGSHAAFGTVAKAGCSMVFGHIHRIQQYRSVFIDESDHLAACVGWLGDKNHPVMQYVKSHPQWQLGFGLAHVEANGHFWLDIKHIIDYATVHDGKVFRRADSNLSVVGEK